MKYHVNLPYPLYLLGNDKGDFLKNKTVTFVVQSKGKYIWKKVSN